jgi:outer membrane protein OmpA-like peptidoglycan-associated protein
MIKNLLSKCWFLWLLLGAWVLASAWWYTCNIKGACEVAPAPIVKVATTDALSMGPLTVHFAPDSDGVLTQAIDAKIREIATFLKATPDAQVVVTGHTNFHSDTAYTERLGLVRAEKLKKILMSYGAPATSIFTESKGQRELLVTDVAAPLSETNKNRRAVVRQIK